MRNKVVKLLVTGMCASALMLSSAVAYAEDGETEASAEEEAGDRKSVV